MGKCRGSYEYALECEAASSRFCIGRSFRQVDASEGIFYIPEGIFLSNVIGNHVKLVYIRAR